MQRILAIAVLLLLALPVHAQDVPPAVREFLKVAAPSLVQQQAAPAQPAKPGVELLPTELDQVGWLLDALTKYPERDRPYLRSSVIPPWGDADWIGALDFAVNAACSQTQILVKADVHANGYLMVWNLERLAPDPVHLKRLIATWDELAVREARFHVPELNLEKRKVKAALLAPHLQAALARHVTDASKSKRLDVLVTQLTQSTGAIYPADFLLEQLLTSVRGKYPEFRQIDFKVEKFTPLQVLLRKRGFFFEQSQDGAGDKGAVLIASGVTGKNRIIDTSYGLFGRQPMAVTFDVKDLRTRAGEKFLRNLVEFERFHDASEIFIPLRNGLIEYVLADAKGNIQRVAPPDVVADHTKPAGFTHELESAMSCITCHFPDGGYKSQRNDLELLLGSDTDFVGDDFSYTNKEGKQIKLSRAQAVAIVAGRYGEPIYDPDGILGRAERDFAKAVATLTNYQITADGPNAVQQLGATIKSVWHSYRYATINADRACLELGVRVEDGQGMAILKQLCPPPPAGQQEDILIGLLRAGASITRDDFDSVHVELARRTLVTRPTLAGSEKKT